MLLKIVHHTHYHYSQPVFLEPFTVRLRPRSDATQTVRSYSIDINPRPSGTNHCIDLDGNNADTIWFSGLHENLLIDVNTIVDTHHGDPFNFLVTDSAALTLPVKYQSHLEHALKYYLFRDSNGSGAANFSQEIMQMANYETVSFLSLLAEQIYRRFKYLLREHGDPWTPEETVKRAEGSCRDFAMLFVDACRVAGIAARFVSGYCMSDIAGSDMHAWAEAYLPGAGWRGFDPSRGLLVADDYVAVAAGQRSQDAAPTFGTFRGEAQSTLKAEMSISVVNGEVAAN